MMSISEFNPYLLSLYGSPRVRQGDALEVHGWVGVSNDTGWGFKSLTIELEIWNGDNCRVECVVLGTLGTQQNRSVDCYSYRGERVLLVRVNGERNTGERYVWPLAKGREASFEVSDREEGGKLLLEVVNRSGLDFEWLDVDFENAYSARGAVVRLEKMGKGERQVIEGKRVGILYGFRGLVSSGELYVWRDPRSREREYRARSSLGHSAGAQSVPSMGPPLSPNVPAAASSSSSSRESDLRSKIWRSESEIDELNVYRRAAGQKDRSCFVTEAAYGDREHPMVKEFRGLRDEILVNFRAGRAFVGWYERNGPRAASVIAGRAALRAAARGVLTPIAKSVRFSRRLIDRSPHLRCYFYGTGGPGG